MHAYLSLSDVNVRYDLRFLLLLSFILHSMCGTPQIKLPILMTKNIDLRHRYGISVAEAQIFLLVKHNWQRRIRGVSCFHKLNQQKAACFLVCSINQSNKFLYSSSFLLFQFRHVQLYQDHTKIALTLIVLNHTYRQFPDSFYGLNRDLVKFLQEWITHKSCQIIIGQITFQPINDKRKVH